MTAVAARVAHCRCTVVNVARARHLQHWQGRWLKLRALASSLPRLLYRMTPPGEIKRLKRIRSEAFEAVKSERVVVETSDDGDEPAQEVPFEKQGDLSLYTMVRRATCVCVGGGVLSAGVPGGWYTL